MNKQNILNTIMFIATWGMGIPCLHAIVQTNISENSDIENSIINIHEVSENECNYKAFEVYTDEGGEYYAEFWLLPAKYSDGSYTHFSVFVNDVFIGNIIPSEGNWQSCRISDNERIQLAKGHNVIKVTVPAPEIPAVETLRLAFTESEAKISSDGYDKFFNNATSGKSYYIPEESTYISNSTFSTQPSQSPEITMKNFLDVPLKYTFYKEFKFYKGDTLKVETSSLSEHDVDIVYIGNNNYYGSGLFNSDQISNYSISTTEDINLPPIQEPDSLRYNYVDTIRHPEATDLKFKYRFGFTEATSEEIQGLNWKGVSTKSLQKQNNVISKTIKIPKTGVYLIRLRHRESGKSGVADIKVNGLYTFSNVPISFTWMPCEIPANNQKYSTMTWCANTDEDDPVLFIHGAAADRIVGINDDISNNLQYDFREKHGLSSQDSYILQEYKVVTSGLSVCNYSSLKPESTCDILARFDESLLGLEIKSQELPRKVQAINSVHMTEADNENMISCSINHDGILRITSGQEIKNINIFEVSGSLISHFSGQGSVVAIPISTIPNLTRAGIYIVSVESGKSIVTKKIVVE